MFQDVVAIHRDRGVAEWLAGSRGKGSQNRVLVFKGDSVYRQLGHQVLRTFLDFNGDGNIALLALIVVGHAGNHLAIAEPRVAIEGLDRLFVAGSEALAIAAVAQPDESLGLQVHALADFGRGEVGVALDVETDDAVRVAQGDRVSYGFKVGADRGRSQVHLDVEVAPVLEVVAQIA